MYVGIADDQLVPLKQVKVQIVVACGVYHKSYLSYIKDEKRKKKKLHRWITALNGKISLLR